MTVQGNRAQECRHLVLHLLILRRYGIASTTRVARWGLLGRRSNPSHRHGGQTHNLGSRIWIHPCVDEDLVSSNPGGEVCVVGCTVLGYWICVVELDSLAYSAEQ